MEQILKSTFLNNNSIQPNFITIPTWSFLATKIESYSTLLTILIWIKETYKVQKNRN